MRTTLLVPVLALTLLGTASALDLPAYPSFTADTELKSMGLVQTGKIAFSKGKVWNQMEQGKQKMTAIMDYPGGKAFTIIPPMMACLEDSIGADAEDPVTTMVGKVEEKVLGEETIDGHPTKKVRMSSTVGGQTQTTVIWKATDLQDLPIRIFAEDGSFELHYTNVKLVEPDPALLAPPKDCKANPLADMLR